VLQILYEDSALVVCIKPAGVLSQGAPGESGGDMLTLLSEQLGCDAVFPVHRLDRGVGGLMVYAKQQAAAGKLSAAVADRTMIKEYVAVVHGAPCEPQGEMVDLLYKDATKNKSFVGQRQRAGVKRAQLTYRVLASYEDEEGAPLTLVRIRLGTGRTHQIRVQFSSRSMPLVGDGKYGARDHGVPVALWSCRLCFPHPLKKGKTIDIFCPPPAEGAFARCEGLEWQQEK
jgi:23S rRNA pseudouridine1911/1915/1917 synthase